MKKKLYSVLLVTVLATSLFACGKKKEAKLPSTVNKEIEAEEYQDTVISNADVYRKMIKLPEWVDTTIDLDLSEYEVNEDDVDLYIDSILDSAATVENKTSGKTAAGDTITLDYSGKLDGVAFSGGTATDVTYTIGSGKFISDLDKGLEGLTVGVETDIPCTFPKDYSSSDLAGKSVIFTVTVQSIQVSIKPDLTDAWVVENAETLGLDETINTVDAFKAYIKEYLVETAKASKQSDAFDELYSVIIEQIEDPEYPEEELEELLTTLNENITKEYESYGTSYGTKEEYLKAAYGFETMDDFDEYAQDYAKQYLLQKMVVTVIAADNDIQVSADDITSTGEELALYYGYDNYDEILSTYGKIMNAEIGYQVLYQKVVEFASDNIAINDKKSE